MTDAGSISFGEWLKQQRHARDLTQEQLGDFAGCSFETIRKIEKGRRRASRHMVEALGRYLRIPPEELSAVMQLARLGSDATDAITYILPPHIADGQVSQPPLRASAGLPAWRTTFIGREHERVQVRDLLEQPEMRLLTLIGPPGIGKTRLSFQVADALVGHFQDGVSHVFLSPVTDPALVCQAIAQALGVKEAPNQPLEHTLVDHLRDKHMLLLLDNFEQVIPAGPLVGRLLAECPRLTVLVSSRTALRVYGEHQFPVPPLSLPDSDTRQPPSFEELAQSEAVELFTQRSQAVKPNFMLTADNAPIVAEICRQLDGLPLAIELAAARSKVLAPKALLARLSSRLNLLTAGMQDLPPRQQTLRGAIAWSYDLLNEEERALFRRMSVFAGGRTLEAVEVVCNAKEDLKTDVLDLVTSLMDKSLLRPVEETGEPRFYMLWTIREYGLECLVDAAEEGVTKSSHAEYFLDLAEDAEPLLKGPGQAVWLNRLEDEHGNLRVALEWSQKTDVQTFARLASALWRFWYVRGYLSEGRGWLDAVREVDGSLPTPLRAKVRYGAGAMAVNQGEYQLAEKLFNESLAMFRELGDKIGISDCINNLGILATNQGDYARAIDLFDRSLVLRREVGDKRIIAGTLNNMANLAIIRGDYDQACAFLEEALEIFETSGELTVRAILLNNLGRAVLNQGDYEAARALFKKSLSIKQELGDKEGIASSLNRLGVVARCEGDYEQAQSLLEESLDLFRELGEKEGIAMVLNNLGQIAREQERYVEARALHEDSLFILQVLGDKMAIAVCLLGLADTARAEGRPERAVRLLGAIDSMLKAAGAVLEPTDRNEYDRNVASTREVLGEDAFQSAWAAGQEMALEQAIQEAANRQR